MQWIREHAVILVCLDVDTKIDTGKMYELPSGVSAVVLQDVAVWKRYQGEIR